MVVLALDLDKNETDGLQFLATLHGASLAETVATLLRETVNLSVCARQASQLDETRPCPQCDFPTRPDPDRPGAWCCDRCGEAGFL